ncbi:MAG TPA: FtsQ-type POTRA domain-containing protein [Nevskiaceae bacterium]
MSAVLHRRAIITHRDRSALPHVVLRWALAMLCALAAGSVVYLARPALDRPVADVDVEGQFAHMDPQQIVAAAALPSGVRLFDVSLATVQRHIEQLPWVASASVTRRWPATLDVRVTERQAIARWGADGLVDRHGDLFYPPNGVSQDRQLASLPRLDGMAGHQGQVLGAWEILAPALKSTPLALASLSQNARGGLLAQTIGGIALHLGTTSPEHQLRLLQTTILPLLADKLAGVTAIDMRYANGFAVAGGPAPVAPRRNT